MIHLPRVEARQFVRRVANTIHEDCWKPSGCGEYVRNCGGDQIMVSYYGTASINGRTLWLPWWPRLRLKRAVRCRTLADANKALEACCNDGS